MSYQMGVDFPRPPRGLPDAVQAIWDQIETDIRGEILNELISVCQDLRAQAPVVNVAPAQVTFTPDATDMTGVERRLDVLTRAFEKLSVQLSRPVTRDITHDADGRIIKVVESR
jgi:hypothetical protein